MNKVNLGINVFFHKNRRYTYIYTMKTTTIGIFALFIITCSCQSEYERQLAKGKDIIEKQLDGNTALITNKANTALQEELEVCAHVSGNKRVFMMEMTNYKAELQQTMVVKQQQLITRKQP